MKKTIKNILASSLVLGFACSSIALAEETIAVVDGNKVFQQFQPAIEENLKKEFKDQQQKLMTMQEDLQKMSAQLDKDAEIMSEAEVEKLQEKFAEKQMEFQQDSVAYSEAYNERGNEEFQKLIDKVQAAAKDLATEKKYSIVLQKGAVLYSDDQYDVTADLIKKLEAAK